MLDQNLVITTTNLNSHHSGDQCWAGVAVPMTSVFDARTLLLKHPINNSHLRVHTVLRLARDNASGTIEYSIFYFDPSSHWHAVHQSACLTRLIEPGLIDAPIVVLVSQLLIGTAISVLCSRTPGARSGWANREGSCHRSEPRPGAVLQHRLPVCRWERD